jgi:hypothetical protein
MGHRPLFPIRLCAAGAVLLAACGSTGPSQPVPADLSLSPLREPAETLSLAPEDQEAIYLSVLRFYRPSGDQVRWLDLRLLPAAAADTAVTLDRALALRLIQSLGTRFCLQDSPGNCAGGSGGVLRVTPVYGMTTERARLVVQFEAVAGPYAPGTAFSGTEVFLVEKRDKEWRISVHAPVSAEAPGAHHQ